MRNSWKTGHKWYFLLKRNCEKKMEKNLEEAKRIWSLVLGHYKISDAMIVRRKSI